MARCNEFNILICHSVLIVVYAVVMTLIIKRRSFGKLSIRIKVGLIIYSLYLPYKVILSSLVLAKNNYSYFAFLPRLRVAYIAGNFIWVGLHW